jgi:hypothetical protein
MIYTRKYFLQLSSWFFFFFFFFLLLLLLLFTVLTYNCLLILRFSRLEFKVQLRLSVMGSVEWLKLSHVEGNSAGAHGRGKICWLGGLFLAPPIRFVPLAAYASKHAQATHIHPEDVNFTVCQNVG